MPDNLDVAPAQPDDFEWAAQLMAASEPWITLQRDIDGARLAVRRPGTQLFIARRSQGAAGFLLLADYGFAGAPYVASIGVAPEVRGTGIGSQLLHWVEKRYYSRGNVFLLVSSFNTRAQQLYFRNGYQKVGEIPDFVVSGHSELILRKSLT